MIKRRLGHSDIQVSVLGLGSMTWGHQNSESDAHRQLDAALAAGINLIDTAEMYPTPTHGETWGSTERFIGSWLANSGRRAEVVLASKIIGPARQPGAGAHIREGRTRHNRANIVAALDGSLKRLQTDYLDLYQLHWPDRTTNIFGQREYPYVEDDRETVSIAETLQVLADQVAAGKIRHIGVSNETPWGVAEFLRQAREQNLPRIVSIQNPYSLLNRLYEGGLSEFSQRDNIGLLAYSPLAFGALTGKYLNGALPQGSRLSSVYRTFNRYDSPGAHQAIAAYVALAQELSISPAQLALAYVINKPFVSSALTGQTSLAQLTDNLGALQVKLGSEALARIEQIHRQIPNPAP
ncbi:NADP(H)-dependent aldo-keto reductase [Pseudomonas sp. 2(2015)]|uniref:NADP(H)-dependent aldo-keto reductase n=1 Tax=Pseudomonas sp. 2(2015) TaxID=1619950 RepID=UPI0005EBEDC9|nr:NADP(H)-dependent aldo-keto reductase [Pseudomonas sp. 2(2015)]KJK18975.1 aldo/keto reductase [Pseudomonas sp. 2(2015)]